MYQQKPLDTQVIFNANGESFDRVARYISYHKERMEKMYSYPARIDLALIHKNANYYGHTPNLSIGQQVEKCPCCQLPINIEYQQINLCFNTSYQQEEAYLLNAGTILFFTFIKMTIIYLALRFFIADGFNLITNILGENCKNPSFVDYCKRSIFVRFSTFNKQSEVDQVYLFIVDILNMVTVVLSIIFFAFYRKYQLTIFQLVNFYDRSQADFTIFVEQIPPLLKPNSQDRQDMVLSESKYKYCLKQLFQNKIREWFYEIEKKSQSYFKADIKFNKLQSEMMEIFKMNFNFIRSQPIIVTSINLCYDLTQLKEIKDRRQKLIQKLKDECYQGLSNEQQKNKIISQVKDLNNQIIRLSIQFAKQSAAQFKASLFLGKAFISFQYKHYRQYFLHHLNEDISVDSSDKKLKISAAAQPSDVYWYNMKVPQHEMTKSILCSSLILIILLILSFGILVQLQYYKVDISNTSSTLEQKTFAEIAKEYTIAGLMTVITIVIGFLIQLAIERLITCQKHITKTDKTKHLIIKTVITQFLNTALIYFLLFQLDESLGIKDIDNRFDDIVVANITSLVFVGGVIQIFFNGVQVREIYKNKRNKCKYPQQQTVNLFQIELNKELQPTEFNFAMRYAYYILNVYVVSFYSYIVPYTSLMLIIIFAIQYWVDKYNLFRRFSCPTDFNYRLFTGISILTFKIFEYSLFFFALGNLLLAPRIHTDSSRGGYSTINIVSLILVIVYYFIMFIMPKTFLYPYNLMRIDSISYKQYKKKKPFHKTYQLQNPATIFTKEYNHDSKFAQASDLKLINQQEHRQFDHALSIFYKNHSHSNEQMKDSQLPVNKSRDL